MLRDHLQRFTAKAWHHEWREAHIGFDVYREGLSILSLAPVTDVLALPLSDKPLRRIALLATTTLKGISLRVCTTHLSWEQADGDAEVEKLLATIDARPDIERAATLLSGDFNSTAGGAVIQRCLARGYVDVGAAAGLLTPTFLGAPQERIDYHFVRAAPGRPPPRVEAFVRTFDGGPADHGYQPRVSDHAGLLGAYSWAPG